MRPKREHVMIAVLYILMLQFIYKPKLAKRMQCVFYSLRSQYVVLFSDSPVNL